jgi:phosphatidate cytidylyltransferase
MSGIKDGKAIAYAIVVVATFAIVAGLEWMRSQNMLATHTFFQTLKAITIAGVVVWAFVLTTQMRPGHPSSQRLRGALGVLIIVIAISSLIILRALTGWQGVLFVLSIVWVADIAAYFCGRRFGRVKLAPAISPGKTREGVYGALIFVAIYSCVVSLIYPEVLAVKSQASDIAGQFLVMVKGRSIAHPGLVPMVLGSLLLALLSVAGDLYESLLKRQAGMKDSGTLLPGHGGVLDRIDALLPVLPTAALAVLLIY